MDNIIGKIVGFVLLFRVVGFSYGEKIDTLPNWQERAVLVLVNACRMSPTEYRDTYLKTTKILLPATYPAVPPLYWIQNLNASSRYHCAEMANGCGMQHTCNGKTFDVRIRSFYSEGDYLAENIAAGYQTPLQVVNGWLLDEQSAGDTALDNSGADGHRKNIMAKNLKVIGCGYLRPGTGKSATPYWCQDFANGKNSAAGYPIPSASHLFIDKNKTTFMLSFFDTTATAVSVTCNIDGAQQPMTKLFGSATKGTYAVSIPTGTACRRYYFEAVSDAKRIRYPEQGFLITSGEGSCTEDFGTGMVTRLQQVHLVLQLPQKMQSSQGLLLRQQNALQKIVTTTVFDLQGKRCCNVAWNNDAVIPAVRLKSGCVVLRHLFLCGATMSERHIVK